ncbi:hypothetical protein KQI88_15235 [Alkaliphilus sp. MSJ-5]|uniref:Uncharacterized protein n=1 Tax=Alkaliphilus flagellatus TaxID=2841507 RepID=A0ABS6G6J0_9FIRM|nr:hypothetical protein [Alkaliphilus flagellatus]MBU5677771.1 hypothetical protein [Alkaliphilus flagellatus]
MLYAIKANRQYKIEEDEKQKFIDRGYEIARLEEGKLVFEEVETEETKEIAKLKAKIKKLEKELEELKKVEDLEKEKKSKGEGK